MSDAATWTGISKGNISQVINGFRNHAGGFRWRMAVSISQALDQKTRLQLEEASLSTEKVFHREKVAKQKRNLEQSLRLLEEAKRIMFPPTGTAPDTAQLELAAEYDPSQKALLGCGVCASLFGPFHYVHGVLYKGEGLCQGHQKNRNDCTAANRAEGDRISKFEDVVALTQLRQRDPLAFERENPVLAHYMFNLDDIRKRLQKNSKFRNETILELDANSYTAPSTRSLAETVQKASTEVDEVRLSVTVCFRASDTHEITAHLGSDFCSYDIDTAPHVHHSPRAPPREILEHVKQVSVALLALIFHSFTLVSHSLSFYHTITHWSQCPPPPGPRGKPDPSPYTATSESACLDGHKRQLSRLHDLQHRVWP